MIWGEKMNMTIAPTTTATIEIEDAVAQLGRGAR